MSDALARAQRDANEAANQAADARLEAATLRARVDLLEGVFGDSRSLARRFHETYERLAPAFGYKTREASAVPWEQVPVENRALMVAVCREIFLATALDAATREVAK